MQCRRVLRAHVDLATGEGQGHAARIAARTQIIQPEKFGTLFFFWRNSALSTWTLKAIVQN